MRHLGAFLQAIIQISEQAQAGAEAAAGLKEMQDYWSARSFSGLIEGDGYEGELVCLVACMQE